MLKRLIKGLAAFALILATLCLVYVGYAHWAWGDIPAAELEQRYGGERLRHGSIDGLNIRYRLEGTSDPEAAVIVLIHSHFLDMGMWDAWVAELDGDYRVLRYDISGHGLTGPDPTNTYTVERDVSLLSGLLDQLSIERAHIVGSSLGGNIAFQFASMHPERTESLVLINSGGLKRKSSRSGREMPAWADQVFPLIPPAALHKFLLWMAADDASVTDALKQRFVDMFRREGNRSAELERLRQFETGDPTATLARVTAPTLILWGEDNPQLPASLAPDFAAKLVNASRIEQHIYAGAGHILPLERPQLSAQDTLGFIRSIDSNQP